MLMEVKACRRNLCKRGKPTQSSEASEEPAKGFMGWITKSLAPKLDKLTQNIYISAIQQSIMSILPMIMIGSSILNRRCIL